MRWATPRRLCLQSCSEHLGSSDASRCRNPCDWHWVWTTTQRSEATAPTDISPRACFADPIALPAFGSGPDASHVKVARKLLTIGRSTLRAVRAGIVCAKRMNLAREAGQSRFDLDLALMVRLIESLHETAQRERLVAYCGKVGGRQHYAAALERLAPLVGIVAEERARSSYIVPRLGEVHFVMDGDATEPAIGLASMIGKYVRELWMHRINRYWTSAVPEAAAGLGLPRPDDRAFCCAYGARAQRTRRARRVFRALTGEMPGINR